MRFLRARLMRCRRIATAPLVVLALSVVLPGYLFLLTANPSGGRPIPDHWDRSAMPVPWQFDPTNATSVVSNGAASVTGRRFLAVHWDPKLPPQEAAEKAGAPVAWTSIATMPITPSRSWPRSS